MQHRHTTRSARLPLIATITAAVLAVAGCSGDASPTAASTGSEAGQPTQGATGEVTIVVHDSFPIEEFTAAAQQATGLTVTVVTAGDGGELTNKLVLTKDAPIADAFFGVDNSFASRLVTNGVVEPYAAPGLPESAAAFAYDDAGSLTPIDHGAVCFNIDTEWFAEAGLTPPQTYEDLTTAQYQGLTVAIDPTASSTGAAFLIGTVSAYGEDGFTDYWNRLLDNGAILAGGWDEAYYTEFTGGGQGGTSPIVLSYSSSPAWTLTEDGTASTTAALLETCTSQIEYAGVLAGAANPEGARALVDYLLSEEFQATIPDAMYMYPVLDTVTLPAEWAQFAPSPTAPHDIPAAEIDQNRETWLRAWSQATGY